MRLVLTLASCRETERLAQRMAKRAKVSASDRPSASIAGAPESTSVSPEQSPQHGSTICLPLPSIPDAVFIADITHRAGKARQHANSPEATPDGENTPARASLAKEGTVGLETQDLVPAADVSGVRIDTPPLLDKGEYPVWGHLRFPSLSFLLLLSGLWDLSSSLFAWVR